MRIPISAGLFLATLLIFISSASAQSPINGCGTIGSGNWYINGSFSGSNCLVISASNVHIDGRKSSGFVLNASGGTAIEIKSSASNVTISNVKSKGSFYLNYGGNAVTVSDSVFNSVSGYQVDNLTVQRTHLKQVSIAHAYDNPVTNLRLIGNWIYESLDPADADHYVNAYSNQHTVYLYREGGSGATISHYRGDWLIDGNTIRNDRPENSLPLGLISAITLRATTHITFTNNLVSSRGGLGIYLRDYIQNSVFSNNIIESVDGSSLHVGSGSYPGTTSYNQFLDNRIRSVNAYSLGIQNFGTDNVFQRNLIVSGPNIGHYLYLGGTNTLFRNNTFFSNTSGAALRISSFSGRTPSADDFYNNVFSFNGADPIAEDVSNADFYANYYDGNFNLFNSRNSVAISRERAVDDQNSTDTFATIFKSTDPNSIDYLKPVSSGAGSVICGAGQSGSHTGRYACSTGTPVPGCTPNWQCSAWSVCTNGFQNRSCIDANACNIDSGHPVENQSCTAGSATPTPTATPTRTPTPAVSATPTVPGGGQDTIAPAAPAALSVQ